MLKMSSLESFYFFSDIQYNGMITRVEESKKARETAKSRSFGVQLSFKKPWRLHFKLDPRHFFTSGTAAQVQSLPSGKVSLSTFVVTQGPKIKSRFSSRIKDWISKPPSHIGGGACSRQWLMLTPSCWVPPHQRRRFGKSSGRDSGSQRLSAGLRMLKSVSVAGRTAPKATLRCSKVPPRSLQGTGREGRIHSPLVKVVQVAGNGRRP